MIHHIQHKLQAIDPAVLVLGYVPVHLALVDVSHILVCVSAACSISYTVYKWRKGK